MADVADHIGDKRNRLGRWMHLKLLHARRAEAVDASIAPDIGPVTLVLAQFGVVDVGSLAALGGGSALTASK